MLNESKRLSENVTKKKKFQKLPSGRKFKNKQINSSTKFEKA